MKRFLPVIVVMGVIMLVLLVLTYWEPKRTDTLDGSIWEVTSLNNESLIKETTLTIRFHNRKVSGSSGCNTFRGTYAIENETISIVIIEATTDNCMNPGIMEQEREFRHYLEEATEFQQDDTQLTVISENGDLVEFDSMLDDQ